MPFEILLLIFIPFLGTVLGAALVFFLKHPVHCLQCALPGFAAGIMTAASIFSLVLPAMQQAAHLGKLAFLPVCIGLWIGFAFLLLVDWLLPAPCIHMPVQTQRADSRRSMLILAVTLHNLPEGMAVGVIAAGYLTGETITAAAAWTLALGIALQNLPEGTIISLPLRNAGTKTAKAFLCGAMSGLIEPVGAIAALLLVELAVPLLPYLLSFAAGAMLFVVVEELVPEMSEKPHSHAATLSFAAGFTLMLFLDTALGN